MENQNVKSKMVTPEEGELIATFFTGNQGDLLARVKKGDKTGKLIVIDKELKEEQKNQISANETWIVKIIKEYDKVYIVEPKCMLRTAEENLEFWSKKNN